MMSVTAQPLTSGERVATAKKQVHCDGGDGPLGHPRIYLNLGDKGSLDCPYCGKVFVYKTAT